MPEPQPLKTSAYLELSTKYMTKRDCELLQEQAELKENNQGVYLVCQPYELGFFIRVFADFGHKTVVRLKEVGFSDDFIFEIYWRCITEGISLIDIRLGGPEQPLPEHDW